MPPKPLVSGTPLHAFAPEDARTFVTDTQKGFGRSRATRRVTRQGFFLDEDDDFDGDKHMVPLAREIQLQQLDLLSEAAHVDAGGELGDGEGDVQRTHMPAESDEAIAQFRSDMRDRSLLQNVAARAKRGTQRTSKVVERQTITRTQAHNEELVREKMRETAIPAFERLAAARALARKERDKAAIAKAPAASESVLLAPDGVGGRQRVVDAREQARDELSRRQIADRKRALEAYVPPEAQAVTVAELRKMLAVSPFAELDRKLQISLLELPDMRSVVSLLQPLLYEDEFDRRHLNTIEVIESMVAAGAKFVDMSRVKMRARLALALDPHHYGAFMVRATSHDARTTNDDDNDDVVLAGGHEHFVDGETSLIVMEFRCVRRNLKSNALGAKTRKDAARRGTNLGDQFAAEAAAIDTNTLDAEDDADAYDDTDDYYDGGNDLKDPAKHFIYNVRLVFVEATDAKLVDETLTDCCGTTQKPPVPKADDAKKSDDKGSEDESESESLDIFAEPKPPRKKAVEQDEEYRFDGGAPTNAELDDSKSGSASDSGSGSGSDSGDSDAKEEAVLGKMHVSAEKARTLVGKWRMNMLIGWLNGTTRPAPLCFRAFHISI